MNGNKDIKFISDSVSSSSEVSAAPQNNTRARVGSLGSPVVIAAVVPRGDSPAPRRQALTVADVRAARAGS